MRSIISFSEDKPRALGCEYTSPISEFIFVFHAHYMILTKQTIWEYTGARDTLTFILLILLYSIIRIYKKGIFSAFSAKSWIKKTDPKVYERKNCRIVIFWDFPSHFMQLFIGILFTSPMEYFASTYVATDSYLERKIIFSVGNLKILFSFVTSEWFRQFRNTLKV